MLLIIVVALHFGLSLAIKVLFFAHGSPVAKKPAEGGGDDASGGEKMFF